MDAPSYPASTGDEKKALLDFIRSAPLGYGPWRDLKGLYKRVEADPDADPKILGAFATRLDGVGLTKMRDSEVGIHLTGDRATVTAYLRDGYLYALTGYNNYSSRNFRVYDLNSGDRMKPARVATLPLTGRDQLALCGDYAVAVGEEKLTLFDIGDPGNVRQTAEWNAGLSGRIVCRYPYIFVAVPGAGRSREKDFHGLRVYSISDPLNPRVVAELPVARIKGLIPSDNPNRLVVVVEQTGFSWKHLPGKGGVRIFDTAVATNPKEIASCDINEVEDTGYMAGDILYIPGLNTYDKKLVIYDFSNPGKPRHLGTWKHKNSYSGVERVTARGGYAYVILANGSVEILDVRDPSHPRSVASIPTYFWGKKWLALDGDELFFLTQERIRVWNVRNPAQPQLIGAPPSPETLGYMKRRVRRVLRKLSEGNPARFAEVAFHALSGDGTTPESLDPRIHWITMDLLYGGSPYWYQQSHGRGGYTRARDVPRFSLRRREERAPEIWNDHPELVESLLTTPKLPYQTHEFAVRVLRDLGRELPTVTDQPTLRKWLAGDSLLLQTVGSRSAANLLDAGKAIRPEVTATAYFRANRSRRQRIERAVLEIGRKNPEWRSKVGRELSERLVEFGLTADDRLTRRGQGTASLLAREFAGDADPESVLRLAPGFLRSAQPYLHELVRTTAAHVEPAGLASWISALSPLTESEREPAMVGLEATVSDKDLAFLTRTALYDRMASAREVAWRLLAASATNQQALAAAWTLLLDQTVVSDGLRTAMSSPYALSLLDRAGISNEQIGERLQTRPFLAELITPETFAGLVRQASPETLLRLIAAMPDPKWQELRGGWLRLLQEGVGLAGVWRSLSEAVDTDESGRLITRLLEDAEYSDALLGIGPEDAEIVLEVRRDPFDGLLRRWVERRESVFTKDSAPLLLAATHELPGVRAWGLERARQVGFGMPFALRLLESEIPASVMVGREFFTAVPAGGDREMDYALALCDSPRIEVRRFGRAFVTERWQTLPQNNLLRALFENPDPESQAFVADRVTAGTESPEDATEFNAEVLRQKNRGRRAKESVKASVAKQGAGVDTATLLELARGSGTPRDAEWALSQLARRALAGEQIPGFSIDGVAG